MSFQYPVEIPGVSTVNFLKTAINEIRKYHGQPSYPAGEFLKMIREKMELVGIDNKLLNRSLNEGFSGGEKKKNEIFQMAVLEPKLAILDETDSGLDIDALRIVANGVNKLKRPDNSTIVITHYQRLWIISYRMLYTFYMTAGLSKQLERNWLLSWKKRDTTGLRKK